MKRCSLDESCAISIFDCMIVADLVGTIIVMSGADNRHVLVENLAVSLCLSPFYSLINRMLLSGVDRRHFSNPSACHCI